MKHQEFLLMGTPQVCSPVALSEFAVDGEHVSIVERKENWCAAIEALLLDKELRAKLGKNVSELFKQHYTYESQYQKLKKVLT